MDLSALRGKRLVAAVIFVAATLVLAIQLITPSPVVVSVSENGAQTRQLGQYFTYSDVSVIAVAASLLGGSGTYLLIHDQATTETKESETHRVASNSLKETPVDPKSGSPISDGDGRVAGEDEEIEPRRRWEETADQLRNNEETVFRIVLDSGGELPQREIVEETDLSKATVSRTLDTLGSKGLIERKRRGMGNVVVLQ